MVPVGEYAPDGGAACDDEVDGNAKEEAPSMPPPPLAAGSNDSKLGGALGRWYGCCSWCGAGEDPMPRNCGGCCWGCKISAPPLLQPKPIVEPLPLAPPRLPPPPPPAAPAYPEAKEDEE